MKILGVLGDLKPCFFLWFSVFHPYLSVSVLVSDCACMGVWVCVCIWVCVSLCLCLCMSVSLCVAVYECLWFCVCMFVCVYLRRSVSVWMCDLLFFCEVVCLSLRCVCVGGSGWGFVWDWKCFCYTSATRFFISTSNCRPSAAGDWIQTDFGPIFTIYRFPCLWA